MKKQLDYLLKVSLALVILMIPFKPVWGSYAMILLGLAGVANAIYLKRLEKPPLFFFLLAGAFVVRVLWLARADDFLYGLGRLETEFPLLIVPFIFSTFKVTDELKTFVIKIYVFMTLSVITFSFIQLILYFQDSPYTVIEYTKYHLDPKWFWDDSRHFASKMLTWQEAHYSFLSVIIIYGMHLLFYLDVKPIIHRFLVILYMVMTLLFLIYTGSRIGLFLFIIGVSCYGLFAVKFLFENKFAFIGLCAASVFILVWCLFTWGEKIEPIRYHYATRAINAWKEKPWMGHGTGAGRIIMKEPEFENKVGWTVNHPHNQFLNELIQFGLVGSVILFLFLIYALANGFSTKNKPLLAVLITGMIFMITEAPLNSNKGLVPFVFIIALLANNGGDISHDRKIQIIVK